MLVLVFAELLSLPTASKQPCPQGWTIKQAKTGGTLGKLLCLWAGLGPTLLMSEAVSECVTRATKLNGQGEEWVCDPRRGAIKGGVKDGGGDDGGGGGDGCGGER